MFKCKIKIEMPVSTSILGISCFILRGAFCSPFLLTESYRTIYVGWYNLIFAWFKAIGTGNFTHPWQSFKPFGTLIVQSFNSPLAVFISLFPVLAISQTTIKLNLIS